MYPGSDKEAPLGWPTLCDFGFRKGWASLVLYAQEFETPDRPRRPALHHLLLLSPPPAACVGACPKSGSRDSPRGAREVRIFPGWLRDHAPARPSAHQRVSGSATGQSDSGFQAARVATDARQETPEERATCSAFPGRFGGLPAFLAAAVLRLQRVLAQKAVGKTALYARESRRGTSGAPSEGVALEQLGGIRYRRRNLED